MTYLAAVVTHANDAIAIIYHDTAPQFMPNRYNIHIMRMAIKIIIKVTYNEQFTRGLYKQR